MGVTDEHDSVVAILRSLSLKYIIWLPCLQIHNSLSYHQPTLFSCCSNVIGTIIIEGVLVIKFMLNMENSWGVVAMTSKLCQAPIIMPGRS